MNRSPYFKESTSPPIVFNTPFHNPTVEQILSTTNPLHKSNKYSAEYLASLLKISRSDFIRAIRNYEGDISGLTQKLNSMFPFTFTDDQVRELLNL